MPGKLDKRQIRHVATLSRIELTDEQVATFGRQFAEIVAYMDKLQELNTDGVEPLTHAVVVQNVFGDDEPRESLSPEQALANAPARVGDLYQVPKVIGDSQ